MVHHTREGISTLPMGSIVTDVIKSVNGATNDIRAITAQYENVMLISIVLFVMTITVLIAVSFITLFLLMSLRRRFICFLRRYISAEFPSNNFEFCNNPTYHYSHNVGNGAKVPLHNGPPNAAPAGYESGCTTGTSRLYHQWRSDRVCV